MSATQRAITSGQQVLLPEATRRSRKEKRVTIAVNSRDRNFGQNIDSNEFRWALRRPLKDVTAIELVSGLVPADLYNINTGWNTFSFGEAGGLRAWRVALTPGQYTPAELAAELQLQLNGLAGAANTYTVAYSSVTKKLTITAATGTDSFTFYFRSGDPVDEFDVYTGSITQIKTPGRIFGFDYFDYTSTAGSLTPPYRVDPDMFLKKLYLYVNADNNTELHRVELGAGRKDCFHIILMDQKEGYYNLNKEMYTPIYYSAPAPIARIATLNISFRDEFYRLVDLGDHDFTLVFEVTYLDT